MAKKKKNIKTEKFSPYTFLVIVSVLGGLIIAGIIRTQFNEYIPQANLFGESGLIKEPKAPVTYNEGDFFRPLLGVAFWVYSVFIVVFIINIFRKNFAYNFIRTIGYTTSKNEDGLYRHQFWLFWLIGIPVGISILYMFCVGIIHLINYQFNTSLSESWWFIIWLPIWFSSVFFSEYKK